MRSLILFIISFLICNISEAQNVIRQEARNNLRDLLTYNNISNQKTVVTSNTVKVYALPESNTQHPQLPSPPPVTTNNDAPTTQTFNPNPVTNFYKEFR